MKEYTVIIVNGDEGDWSALYVDGYLECEGHNVYLNDWVTLINTYRHFKEVKTRTVSQEFIEDSGNFPQLFAQIPDEVLR